MENKTESEKWLTLKEAEELSKKEGSPFSYKKIYLRLNNYVQKHGGRSAVKQGKVKGIRGRELKDVRGKGWFRWEISQDFLFKEVLHTTPAEPLVSQKESQDKIRETTTEESRFPKETKMDSENQVIKALQDNLEDLRTRLRIQDEQIQQWTGLSKNVLDRLDRMETALYKQIEAPKEKKAEEQPEKIEVVKKPTSKEKPILEDNLEPSLEPLETKTEKTRQMEDLRRYLKRKEIETRETKKENPKEELTQEEALREIEAIGDSVEKKSEPEIKKPKEKVSKIEPKVITETEPEVITEEELKKEQEERERKDKETLKKYGFDK